MTRYEFQSTAYRNADQMLVAIAGEWLSAGGMNDDDEHAKILATNTDDELAAECISGWGLDVTGYDGEPSHMDFNGYTATDLAAAFHGLR